MDFVDIGPVAAEGVEGDVVLTRKSIRLLEMMPLEGVSNV